MAEYSKEKSSVGGTGSASGNGNFEVREILAVVWGLRWWIVISVAICLIFTYCKLRVDRMTYSANATVMLVNRNTAGAEVNVMRELTGYSSNKKAVNEMEIFKSNAVMRRVVEHLGLNYEYKKSRRIKPIIFDLNSSPFAISYDGEENYPDPVGARILFTPVDTLTYTFKDIYVNGQKYIIDDRPYKYGEDVAIWGHKIAIRPTGISAISYGEQYEISMKSSLATAKELGKRLSVSLSTSGKSLDRPDIIYLEFTDIHPHRCEVILEDVIFQYNEDAKRFNNQATMNTLEFLNDRLAKISTELGDIENQYQDYRRNNTLVDVGVQSSMTLSSAQTNENKLDEVNVQLQLIGMVKNYVEHMQTRSVIPANVGLEDAGLNGLISEYNALVLERNRMVASSSENNPIVISTDSEIQEMLSSIRASTQNLEKSYTVRKNSLLGNIQEGRRKMSAIPNQQLAMSGFERQQSIKEPLYILLQQKREEAMISLYAVPDQCKVVDGAAGSAHPTSPNKFKLLLLAILIGIVIPPAIFYTIQVMRSTVGGKSDITSRTNLPIMASIPNTSTPDQIFRANGRSPYEEAFRVMRTNFRYYNHRVYQITSSLSHEGKSFISSNIAVALAYSGRKVLLVGLDLRKPRLGQIFKIAKHTHGVTSYLIGKTDDVNSIINKNISGIENLDVIFAGAIPPNPSELIESERMASFVDAIKAMDYDYILFDSCPYLPVADSVSVGNFVDANIMVLRCGRASLKFVDDLDGIASYKLKNVSIVLNGVDLTSRTYGYYNGYGYGYYGYGTRSRHGYGYGYGTDNPKHKKKSLFGSSKPAAENPEYVSTGDGTSQS